MPEPRPPRYGDRDRTWKDTAGLVLFWLGIPLGLGYLVFLVRTADWGAAHVVIPFLVAEVGYFLLYLIWGVVLGGRRVHAPRITPPQRPPSVDVFITVCKEPLDVVEPTLRAALSLSYEPKTVWILDDGDDDELEALAVRLGARYLRRTEKGYRKAGNLNHGLEHSQGEIVLALDADQVPEPGLIRDTVGYFDRPRIGFVQTEQRYLLPEGDPWSNADRLFYRAMQPSKDEGNSAISCGTGVLYRRAALEEVGGFSEWNVVEDLHTSLQLHAKGWRSVYHNHPRSTGTAPADIAAQVKQRWQWAVDGCRLLIWDNPLRYRTLAWRQRLQYLHFGYHYVCMGLFMPVFFLVPIWSLFTGAFVLTSPLWVFAAARLPYLACQVGVSRFRSRGHYSFKSFQMQAGLFAVFLHAFLTALLSRRTIPGYKVTTKKADQVPLWRRATLVSPQLAVILGSVGSLAFGAYMLARGRDPVLFAVNACWAGWAAVVLSRITWLAFTAPPQRVFVPPEPAGSSGPAGEEVEPPVA